MPQRGRPRHPDVLTPREWEVLELLREKLTNEQIAERLGITPDGAKYHVSQILSKLDVDSREEAAMWKPQEARLWWRILAPIPFAAKAAGVALIATTVAGLGVLAWGVVSTSDGNDPEIEFRNTTRLGCPLGAECPASPVWSPTGEYVEERLDAALYVLWLELDTTATIDFALVSRDRLLATPTVVLTDDTGREYQRIGNAATHGDILYGTATFERPPDNGQELILSVDYPRALSVGFARNVDSEHGCCYREGLRIAPEALDTPRGQILYTLEPCGWSLTVFDGDESIVNQAPFTDCE